MNLAEIFAWEVIIFGSLAIVVPFILMGIMIAAHEWVYRSNGHGHL